MRLKFVRFDHLIDFDSHLIWTLQVEDRLLFSRMIDAMQSEKGDQAEEPYLVMDQKGKKIAAKKAFIVLDSLPRLPLEDRPLLGGLYKHFDVLLQGNEEAQIAIKEGFEKIDQVLMNEALSMWGSYQHDADWNIMQYMKTFEYGPAVLEGETLLEKCIALFQLLVDSDVRSPVVMVNAKSFFDAQDMQLLFEQAFFHGISLLLMESWRCDTIYKHERKLVIDQDLLEY